MTYTLTDASKALKVCRQTLSNKIKHYQIETIRKGNSRLISEADFLRLQKAITQKRSVKKSVKRNVKRSVKNTPHFNIDPSMLAFLQKQIETQNKQIETLQKSLDQQQQLQLISTQRVETLEQRLLAAPTEATPSPPPESIFGGLLRRVFL